MFIKGILLAVFALSGFIDVAWSAQTRQLDWGYIYPYDINVRTKEEFLRRIETRSVVSAGLLSRNSLLRDYEKVFGRSFANWNDFRNLILSGEATVVPSQFQNRPVAHFVKSRKEIGYAPDSAKSGEYSLFYRGYERLQLSCGQGIENPFQQAALPSPQIVPPPMPAPVRPTKSMWDEKFPPLPTIVVQRQDCRWVYFSNPSPPISASYGVGVWNSGSGVAFNHGMSMGASHSQKSWVCN